MLQYYKSHRIESDTILKLDEEIIHNGIKCIVKAIDNFSYKDKTFYMVVEKYPTYEDDKINNTLTINCNNVTINVG